MGEGPETGRPAGEGSTGGVPGPIRLPRQADGTEHPPVVVPHQVHPHQVRDERRGDVVLRHARLTGRGRPTFCSPTRAEQSGAVRLSTGRGADGKVIYPSREAAEAAARELEDLGARRLRPYLCDRSRHGHYHLATDHTRPLHQQIPQQRRSA